jgi:plastocyanin
VRTRVIEAVVLGVPERKIVFEKGPASMRAEDGDDVRWEMRCYEEREELDGETHAGVVEEGKVPIEAFGCF